MFKTPTEEAKFLIEKYLKMREGTELSKAQIIDYVNKQATLTMTEGVINGAVKQLSDDQNSFVTKVSRGFYSYMEDKGGKSMVSIIYNGNKESIDFLESTADNINVFDLSPEDVNILKEWKKAIDCLKSMNQKLLEEYPEEIK